MYLCITFLICGTLFHNPSITSHTEVTRSLMFYKTHIYVKRILVSKNFLLKQPLKNYFFAREKALCCFETDSALDRLSPFLPTLDTFTILLNIYTQKNKFSSSLLHQIADIKTRSQHCSCFVLHKLEVEKRQFFFVLPAIPSFMNLFSNLKDTNRMLFITKTFVVYLHMRDEETKQDYVYIFEYQGRRGGGSKFCEKCREREEKLEKFGIQPPPP